MSPKILGRKAYHRIPHLHGSHLSKGDFRIPLGQSKICTEKERKGDKVIVQEKLDGSSVAIARIDGILIPVVRSGNSAMETKYRQHKMFANWFYSNQDHFEFLEEDQRLCGEWLAQAHGTKYDLQHIPFVPFDLLGPGGAKLYDEFNSIVPDWFPRPYLLHEGGSFSIAEAEQALGQFGHHGATELAEGAVWRVERDGKLEFMAKYVREDKAPGEYLERYGAEPVWNLGLEKWIS